MANGFMLALKDDGNLVVCKNGGEPLWASGTSGIDARELIMQKDGNLVLYANDGSAAWASGTDNRGKNNRLDMQDDGQSSPADRCLCHMWRAVVCTSLQR